MDFFDWSVMGTCTGATLAVALFTQLLKNLPGIAKLPTQLLSYVLAVGVLALAMVFGETGFSWAGFALALINAALVSLAANGGYAAINRIREGLTGSDGGEE